MKLKKFSPLLRGVAATTAALLTVSTVAYGVAKSSLAVDWVDGYFGVNREQYMDWDENVPEQTIKPGESGYLTGKAYAKTHGNTIEEFLENFVEHAKKQGEEGFALLKNDNSALPLNKSKEVVLFGWNAFHTPLGHTGLPAGNFVGTRMGTNWRGQPVEVTGNSVYEDISLYAALNAMDDINVNATVVADDFTGAMAAASYGEYEIKEVFEAKNSWNISSDSTAIVMVGRGGAENGNYKPDSATNADDPLALSTEELEMIKYAKDHCAKVVLLVVSANAMELGPAVEKNGQYEVDAIGFCGVPNDFQYAGIANVLAGKANATGGLTDTYVYDNSFNPATINMGQQQYADLDTISEGGDLLGRENVSYSADNYIVEAEGIYVGYKYYETRYYDSMADATGTKAKATKGSTTGAAWDYANEVVFPFGQSLSYIPYTQEITNVTVDKTEKGNVTATVKITNESTTQDGYFLAQLYVSRPYTQYDKTNKVEKSAIDFLNSAKIEVAKNSSKTVEITVPTRYLASWDSTALDGEGTYILDEGDYIFTAAAGAHAAVNNVLAAKDITTDNTTTIGATKTWNLNSFDNKTYATSNGYAVRNQMENADINYFYGEEKVTYLSRRDWEGTFPKNYTNTANDSGIQPEAAFTIKGAAKEDEWRRELQNAQYKVTPVEDESKWANIEGVKPEGLAEGQSVWNWILSVAVSNPAAFNNINSDQWQAVKAAIDLGAALNSVGQSGGTSKTFNSIGNPASTQSESVMGYQQTVTFTEDTWAGHEGKEFKFNIASNTLLGSSFNPELALEWGELEGESGMWIAEMTQDSRALTVWGAGLNQHRHAYCGRNSEYMSEDPMLTNRIGEAQMRGAVSRGAICGPKHMGFNDQELNRVGNACYMTEQKVRETDTRCYEGALRADEGNGTGVMMSFARIGASNTTNSVGYINNIMRGEWGFTGIISTDMGRGGYHEVGAMIMATVNEYAGFGGGSVYTDMTEDTDQVNKATYITLGDARKDPEFANMARQTALYMLYTLAHSSSGLYVEYGVNNGTTNIVIPAYTIHHHEYAGLLKKAPWENIFIALEAVFGVLTGLAGVAWIASVVLPEKEDN